MKRKILDRLMQWKSEKEKLGLIVSGPRQVGKTYAVRELGGTYVSFLELNFYEHAEYKDYFFNCDAKRILNTLSIDFSDFRPSCGNTLLFLDEVQDCPEAISAMKFLVQDGTIDVIASGSLLGTHYRSPQSYPVGYVQEIDLGPMDFEEYLWAIGYDDDVTVTLREHVRNKEPFEPTTLRTFQALYRQYMLVGGMPAAVLKSIESPDFGPVSTMQQAIIDAYEKDIISYADRGIRTKALQAFSLIPQELSRSNKRFMFRDIEGRSNTGTREYEEPVDWLDGSGFVRMCRRVTSLENPLSKFTKNGSFKMYVMDTGLLIQMLGGRCRSAIAKDDISVNEGAIAENMVIQMLSACGLSPFYYERPGEIEIDFVTMIASDLVAIEVKSGKKRRARSLNKLKEDGTGKFVSRFVKFAEGNIEVDENGVEHYPLFCAAFTDSMSEEQSIVLRKRPSEHCREELLQPHAPDPVPVAIQRAVLQSNDVLGMIVVDRTQVAELPLHHGLVR